MARRAQHLCTRPPLQTRLLEHVMNKIIWLVGAVVIVIAILSWLGFR